MPVMRLHPLEVAREMERGGREREGKRERERERERERRDMHDLYMYMSLVSHVHTTNTSKMIHHTSAHHLHDNTSMEFHCGHQQ